MKQWAQEELLPYSVLQPSRSSLFCLNMFKYCVLQFRGVFENPMCGRNLFVNILFISKDGGNGLFQYDPTYSRLSITDQHD